MSFYRNLMKAGMAGWQVGKKIAQYRNKRRGKVPRRKVYRASARITRQLGISDRYFCKLKYVDVTTPTITLTNGGAAFIYNSYNLNALTRPNAALGASANNYIPLFSEYSNFYNRYKVHAVKMSCTVTDNGSQSIYSILKVQDDAQVSTLNSWANWRKEEGNRYTVVKLIGQSSGMNLRSSKLYVDLTKYNGNRQTFLGDLGYSGITGGNSLYAATDPARLFEGYVALLTPDGNTITTTTVVPVKVTIQFYVELYDRIDLFS